MFTALLQIITSASFPWYMTRAAAITAYLLMYLVIVIGTGMTTSYSYKVTNPLKAWVIHKYLSIALGVAVIIHMVSLLFDKFINFSLINILIPFSSSYSPIYLSLGIFAFYVLLIVMLSSLLFRLKYPKFWRQIHYFVYLLFFLGFLHGVLIGTDTKTIAMQLVYWLTGLSGLGLFIYRFFIYNTGQE